MFTVMPAIDVQDGRVVRLYQGKSAEATVYGDDPLSQAAAFVAQGAPALHLVDLDAAFGRPPGLDPHWVKAIVGLGVPVELGGGIRSREAAARWLMAGVARLVVGSALRDPDLLDDLTALAGPERITVSLDVLNGQLRLDGWRTAMDLTPADVRADLRRRGLTRVIVTAVDRDGTSRGPDLALVAGWIGEGFEVTAAGGIRHVGDLRALKAVGASGAVVGRALYEGALTMKEALAC
jgi:phosphoribosylformimino-5-aminoimidazole carboxamide ribotide isomerase